MARPSLHATAPSWLARAFVGALGSAVATGGTACGGDETSDTPPPARPTVQTPVSDRPDAETLAALGEGDVAALLEVLALHHGQVRDGVGPHVLTWHTDFELKGSSAREPLPELDAAVVDDQHIEDEGTLTWASGPGEAPRWSLSQTNDHERGREVVAVGPTMFVRMRHRGWIEQAYEPLVAELWLDDAYATAYDAIELAAPRLSITTERKPGAGIDGGDALAIALSLADAAVPLDASRPSAMGVRRAWRDGAEIQAVQGALTLDATTGAWLSAGLQVQYSLLAADERRMVGSLALAAELRPGPTSPVVAPADATPLPHRRRPDAEREAVMSGL